MKTYIFGVLIGLGVIGLFIIGSNQLNEIQCANNVTEMGLKYRYDAINGCRIEYKPNQYIYWKMYRNVDIN